MREASQRLIVALDVPSAEQAKNLVARLDGIASFFKVGLELYTAAGPDFVRWLVAGGKKVFLDLKFLDIEETVRRATEQAAHLGATLLTVHESGNTRKRIPENRDGKQARTTAAAVGGRFRTE